MTITKGPLVKLCGAIMGLLESEHLTAINCKYAPKDKKVSYTMQKIRHLLDCKEWKQLEHILDEIASGKWDKWFRAQIKEGKSQLVKDPLIKQLITYFYKVYNSKEFRDYSNMAEYQKCMKKSLSRYDKKMAKNILTCYDASLQKLIKVVSTEDWFMFSDFIYYHRKELVKVTKQTVENIMTRNGVPVQVYYKF